MLFDVYDQYLQDVYTNDECGEVEASSSVHEMSKKIGNLKVL